MSFRACDGFRFLRWDSASYQSFESDYVIQSLGGFVDNKTTSFTRRRLPHWVVSGHSYFVTFRLRGSLPKDVVLRLKRKREELLSLKNNEGEFLEFQRWEFKEIEKTLDNVHNDDNAFLADADIAPILIEAFEFLENKYCWRFPSFVIMPNHVHCLCVSDKEGDKISLTDWFGQFKKYTAREINRNRGKNGRGWVDENFDHWCRTPEKEEGVKRYILKNPVKAGLTLNVEDWKWKK